MNNTNRMRLIALCGNLMSMSLVAADEDKNHVHLTGTLSDVAVTAPGPMQRVSFQVETNEPHRQEIPVVCHGADYHGLGCTDFVGRGDLIGALMEFVGELVTAPHTKDLEFHLTETPRVLAKPEHHVAPFVDRGKEIRAPGMLLSALR